MDLRKLRHLLVLTEELNFARAAAKLHLTQPALSRSIQALEEELRCQLFDRDPQGVRVTPVGRQVAQRARDLLQDARSLQQEVDMLLRREIGDVKLGTGPLPMATLLPPVLAELARTHPGVHVEIESQSAQELMTLLLDGAIEFFVGDLGSVTVDRRMTMQPLVQQHMSVFGRAGHPLASAAALAPDALRAYPIVTGRRPAAAGASLARHFGVPEGDPFPAHVLCDNIPLLVKVALGSDALAIVTYAAVRDELATGALVEIDMQPPLNRFADIGIVRLAGWTLSPAAEWLIERLRDFAGQTA